VGAGVRGRIKRLITRRSGTIGEGRVSRGGIVAGAGIEGGIVGVSPVGAIITVAPIGIRCSVIPAYVIRIRGIPAIPGIVTAPIGRPAVENLCLNWFSRDQQRQTNSERAQPETGLHRWPPSTGNKSAKITVDPFVPGLSKYCARMCLLAFAHP